MAENQRSLVVLATRGADHELSSVAFTIACGGLTAGLKVSMFLTSSAVDLDQIFNTLDPQTRRGLQQIIQGSATQLRGKGLLANQSLKYLSPTLSTSSLVGQELARDQVEFQRFVKDTSGVVTTIASRRNDLDRLVNASKPATKQLAPFLKDLRPLVKQATPTIENLQKLIVLPGANNDLVDLLKKQPKLANLAKADFPRTIKALQKGQPVVDYLRPYAPDFTGWLTKFAEGAANYDANGHFARIMPMFNAFSLTDLPTGPTLTYSPNTRLSGFQTFQQQRCPGAATQSAPDGSNPYREPQTTCNPNSIPPGP